MKYCPKCGKQVSQTATFCPHCGTKLAPSHKSYNPIVAVVTLVFDLFAFTGAMPVFSDFDKMTDNSDSMNPPQMLPKSGLIMQLIFMLVVLGWTLYYYKSNKKSLPKLLKWILIIAIVIVGILTLDVAMITIF